MIEVTDRGESEIQVELLDLAFRMHLVEVLVARSGLPALGT